MNETTKSDTKFGCHFNVLEGSPFPHSACPVIRAECIWNKSPSPAAWRSAAPGGGEKVNAPLLPSFLLGHSLCAAKVPPHQPVAGLPTFHPTHSFGLA